MKANDSLRINMPRTLELISFFFLGHGPTYPISDLSGSAVTRGNCIAFQASFEQIQAQMQFVALSKNVCINLLQNCLTKFFKFCFIKEIPSNCALYIVSLFSSELSQIFLRVTEIIWC